MGNWTPTYTPEQRHAIETAGLAGKLTLANIQRHCEAGTLTPGLDAFPIPYSSVQYIARAARKRRAGMEESPLNRMNPTDANENIRRRLINLADRELTALERQKRQPDPKLVREWARCAREAGATPGPQQRRLPAEPSRTPGETAPQHTLAGSITRTAHRINHTPNPTPQHA